MRRNIIETVIAAMVPLVAAVFLVFGLSQTRQGSLEGYAVTASFAETPTLRPGAEVRIAGVAMGRVMSVLIDPKTYDVEIGMTLRHDVPVPKDSVASIGFDGLMGDAVVDLKPGRSSERLGPGDRIVRTVSPVNLVDQVGRFIYGSGVGDGAPDDF